MAVALFFLIGATDIRRLEMSDKNDPGPRAVPVTLGLVLLIGGIIQISLGLIQRRRSTKVETVGLAGSRRGAKEAVLLGGALFFYYLLVPWAGFYAPTFIFGWVMAWRMGARWWAAGLAAALLIAVIRVLFVGLFRVQLPQGAYGGWF